MLSQVPDLDPEMRDKLLATVADKPGAKRAAKLAAILAAKGHDDEEEES